MRRQPVFAQTATQNDAALMIVCASLALAVLVVVCRIAAVL